MKAALRLAALLATLYSTGCGTTAPWMKTQWRMDGCSGTYYRQCHWWRPASSNATGIDGVSPSEEYAEPLRECLTALRSSAPSIVAEEDAEEFVKSCMQQRGWAYAGLIATP